MQSEYPLQSSIVVISDLVEHQSWFSSDTLFAPAVQQPEVVGGYLERLPLAAIAAGL
jgi:hypothetical protein